MSRSLDEKLKNFVCRRCNECCKKPGFVYIEVSESEQIARYLGLDLFEFVNKYCELQDRKKLVLKKKPDESCIFLDAVGCRIHKVKPKQCQQFPVKWRTKNSFDYCLGLKEVLR